MEKLVVFPLNNLMIPRFVVIYNQKDKSKVREQNARIFDQRHNS